MPQPFVAIKNPDTVGRYVVILDLEPEDSLAGRELTVDFTQVPNEPPRLHSRSSIFPDGQPHRDGYDFIIVNPRTLDYVQVNILAVESYESGQTHSSFSYRVICNNRVHRFPRQHRCPEVANAACAAAGCDILGCKVGSETYRTDRPIDDELELLFDLTSELEERLDEARIAFELEIRTRFPGQALFVRDGYTGSKIFKVDVMPLRRDPAGC